MSTDRIRKLIDEIEASENRGDWAIVISPSEPDEDGLITIQVGYAIDDDFPAAEAIVQMAREYGMVAQIQAERFAQIMNDKS